MIVCDGCDGEIDITVERFVEELQPTGEGEKMWHDHCYIKVKPKAKRGNIMLVRDYRLKWRQIELCTKEKEGYFPLWASPTLMGIAKRLHKLAGYTWLTTEKFIETALIEGLTYFKNKYAQ